jgi:hypothetical protein
VGALQLALAKIKAEDDATEKEAAMPVYGSQVCDLLLPCCFPGSVHVSVPQLCISVVHHSWLCTVYLHLVTTVAVAHHNNCCCYCC